MDYRKRQGLSGFFIGSKAMILLCILMLGCNLVARTAAESTNEQPGIDGRTEVAVDEGKSGVTKRQEPEAQRREHIVNSDGTVNYQGSGSGHDSGDLIPPSGGGAFTSKFSGPGLSSKYGPPSESYGVPNLSFGNAKPSSFYGPPFKSSFRPPKNGYLPPAPKPQYGPPSSVPAFSPLPPRPVYGPPKGSFGPPSPPKGSYGAPKPNFSSRPKPVYGPPNFSSGTPLTVVGNSQPHFGPPKFGSSHGTPLLPSSSYGSPDSPSPPEVKFDGWKPIPGLVSKPPSDSYGPPSHGSGDGGSFIGATSSGSSSFHGSSHSSGSFGTTSFSSGPGISLQPSGSYGPPSKPSSSYGTPLAPTISFSGPGGFGGGSSSKGHFFGSISGFGSGSSSFSKRPSSSFHFRPPKSHGGSFSKPPSSFFSSHKRPSSSYGPPRRPSSSYGPPSFNSFSSSSSSAFSSPGLSYGPPKPPSFGHIKPPSGSYGPPKPPSSSYGPPKPPSSFYGPPKPPSSSYGPPKPPSDSYGPPTGSSGIFGPPKPPSGSYGPPTGSSSSFGHSKPSSSYGPPSSSGASFSHSKPSNSYGVPTGPSGSFAPPKPPSNSYGPPPSLFTNYKIPKPSISITTPPSTSYRGPPVPHPLQPPAIGTSSLLEGLYNKPLPPTALYGVPDLSLPPLTSVGCCGPASLDVTFQGLTNSYGVPISAVQAPVLPPTSYAPTSPAVVPYQAYGVPLTSGGGNVQNAHSHNHGHVQGQGHNQGHSHTNTDPSIPPTVLPLPQPKKPVKFRPPVPEGLISSIGAKWSSSGAWGGQSQSHHHHHHHQGPAYIPPAVPDPDPGVRANKGNPTIIPPPTAPPVQYGPPPSSAPPVQYGPPPSSAPPVQYGPPPSSAPPVQYGPPQSSAPSVQYGPPSSPAPTHSHHEVHHQASQQLSSSNAANNIESGLNPPPQVSYDQSNYQIQQSIPLELPSSNEPITNYNQNFQSSVISYNANVDNSHQVESHAASTSVGSQSLSNNIQTIPIKGNQGTYTLQIQAAGGNGDQHVPHGEVLSNGLLQDILAAIENPSASPSLSQYSNNSQVSDPVANEIGMSVLKQLGGTLTQEPSISHQLPTQYGKDLAHASSDTSQTYQEYSQGGQSGDPTTFYTTVNENSNYDYHTINQSHVGVSEYLNKNNIAFYYNNQMDLQERNGVEKDSLLVQTLLPNNSTRFDSRETDFGSYAPVNLQNAQNSSPHNTTTSTTANLPENSGR